MKMAGDGPSVAPLRPARHHYGVEVIELFLRMVLSAATSLRGAAAVLDLLGGQLPCLPQAPCPNQTGHRDDAFGRRGRVVQTASGNHAAITVPTRTQGYINGIDAILQADQSRHGPTVRRGQSPSILRSSWRGRT